MAAGAGFKTFATGDVLTAADTNGYLMQGIWVFANATARDAAVTSPQEGNACYLKDTDQILVYSGSAWVVKSGGSPLTTKGDLYTYSTTDARLGVGTNGQVLQADSTAATGLKWATAGGGGKVLQVVNATYSTETTTTSATYADTGLTATITPTLNTSKILVIVSQPYQQSVSSSGNELVANIKIVRASTDLTAQGFTLRASAYSSELALRTTFNYTYLDSPATTSATTYKTQFNNANTTGNFRICNNSTIASITLMEIGA
jgi:hypothetical protein